MTSQRHREKEQFPKSVWKETWQCWATSHVINKLALAFQVTNDVTMTSDIAKRTLPWIGWKETWQCWTTSHIKQIGIDIPQ